MIPPASSPPPAAKPPCHRDDALAVLAHLRASGHTAYFAGGCVRDLLLGISPKDYDVATDAPPARVRSLFGHTQAVGQAFGVILVRQGKSVVEVATFRADGQYTDGRRPDAVRFTSAPEDAQRRDFTINGLFLDPLASDADPKLGGRVLDYVGGQADLAARLVRAIGDPRARFAEDHLRLLRAVRFAARLDFSIEPDTARAIADHADHLKRISPERVGEELRAMLRPPSRAAAWRMLGALKLAPVLFRFLAEPAPLRRDGLVAAILPERDAQLGLILAAASLEYLGGDLADRVSKPTVRQIVRGLRQSLKITNDESDELAATLEGVGLLLAMPRALAPRKRFLARPTADLSRILLRAIAQLESLHANLGPLDAALDQLAQTPFAPTPLISGDDLFATGLTPGPAFKQALDAAYDAQLEGQVSDKPAALALAVDWVRRFEKSPPPRGTGGSIPSATPDER